MESEELRGILARLRKQGSDDGRVEAKACASSLSPSVWESVSAFANTDGGLLLLGVSEIDGFKAVRPFALDKVLGQFVSGMGDAGSGSRISNPPHYRIERVDLDGDAVLAIRIDPLELALRPCYVTAKGIAAGSYKRIDDRDIRLSPTEIHCMLNVMSPFDGDIGPVAGSLLDDFDDSLVENLLRNAASSAPKALRGAEEARAKSPSRTASRCGSSGRLSPRRPPFPKRREPDGGGRRGRTSFPH